MAEPGQVKVAIVDYGLGNLFSVRNACHHAGMLPNITSSAEEILASDLVVLPGVGAFGDAMESLKRLDLVKPLREIAFSNRPLMGICLGMQLLMTESYEFGRHEGLGIIEGPVVRLDNSNNAPVLSRDAPCSSFKVPQVGWNRIFGTQHAADQVERAGWSGALWQGTPLQGLRPGEYMYFVHSYYPKPVNSSVVLSTTKYGGIEFSSSLRYNNVFACQFHPERSGPQGLQIYRNIALLFSKRGIASRRPDRG